MLSWMRWLTSWFWSIFNSGGTSGGFLGWFTDHWVSLAVFLIIAGAIIDWLIWMIRWRPYWLWLRKRQIIYEEVPEKQEQKRSRRTASVRSSSDLSEEISDPFASTGEDPYAPVQPKQPENDMAEWDSNEDPYAHSAGPVVKKVNKFGRQEPF